MRLLKCYGTCENKYAKEDLIKYKGKNYCKECYEKIIERDKDYENLCKYICEIFNCPFVNPYIKMQIKQFEQGGFSLKGMRSTLWYITTVLGITLKEQFGIAMVKYKYYEAKKYFEEKMSQKKQVQEKKEEKTEVKYVNINRFRENKIKKRFSLSDISLEEEEDNE